MNPRSPEEPSPPPCRVVAEVGANHDGDLERALVMVARFAALGADAIKFQFYRPDRLYPAGTMVADYLVGRGGIGQKTSISQVLARCRMGQDWPPVLAQACRAAGVGFISSVFDPEGVPVLRRGGVEAFKIASTEITHYPLLRQVGATGLPVIVSTGMASLGEVEKALVALGHERVTLLHCTACYPTAPADVNLRAMLTLRQAFGLPVGFSDHTEGPLAAALAAGLGACMVEKHVTLDRRSPGPDHAFAAEPEDFAAMVQAVRQAGLLLGDRRKAVRRCEAALTAYRPGLFAARDIAAGERLATTDLEVRRRDGSGIGVEHLEIVVGMRARVDIARGAAILWDMV